MMRTSERWMVGFRQTLVQFTYILVLALVSPMSGAEQYVDTEPDPHPLRPADTSSPRDTLRSFLENVDESVDAWRGDELNARSIRAYQRALETLDLSSTPHSDAWWVRTERMLLLKEILDRIELPPESEIPGDIEVADGTVMQWTIPDTRITIARIGDGLRAGEFLFSAETVQQVHRHYAHAKHLPYKPGVSAGLYGDWVRSERTDRAREQRIRNRLKPVDTSTPRSTLAGFLDSVNRAYALVMEADAALTASQPTMTLQEAREADLAAANLLARAVQTLDLSEVPEVLREDVGSETALQLKEILDRMRLPPLDTVPDAWMVAAARERAEGPVRWRYPNTEIEIAEVTEGERQGQFLFSAATVARINDYMVTPDPARVRFVGFSAYSLDVDIFAYLRCVEQDIFLAVQEDLFLRIADIVSEAGSGFAFPSQTAYLARDAGLDDERATTAESRVSQQRATGKLPFPEFEENEREKLENILDYPPKGSHDYQPRPGVSDTQDQ